jgi:arylsulfatase A-like enzyme
VGHLDVYQTVVDLVGAERPAATFGHSLLPLLAGEAEPADEAVFAEIGRASSQDYMVRTGRHKWFVRAGRESLFDLHDDPFELADLAAAPAHQALLQEMRERLRRHLMQSQVVLSAGYKPLFTRAGIAVGDQDVASRMLALFHRLHEPRSGKEPA